MRNGYRSLAGGPGLGIAVGDVGTRRTSLKTGCATCSRSRGQASPIPPATGALLPTAMRGTHEDNNALVVALSATVKSFATLLKGSSIGDTEAYKTVWKRMSEISPRVTVLKQHIDSEDYDFTGEYNVSNIHDELVRLTSEVKKMVATINEVVKQRGSAREQAAAEAVVTITKQAEASKTEEEKEKAGLFDAFLAQYGTYLKIGGGLFGLMLVAYLFGPLVRGLGARAGAAPKQLPAPTTNGFYLLR